MLSRCNYQDIVSEMSREHVLLLESYGVAVTGRELWCCCDRERVMVLL